MDKVRDMSKIYRHMSTFDLLALKSRKITRYRRLENSFSYLDKQEKRRIEFNLKQINAELACRAEQMALPL